MAISQGCPLLQMINLSYCTEITDNALKSLSKCSNLNTLELRGCSQVSNYGLVSIALGCKEIVKLDIKKCYDITDVGVVPLAHLCGRLRQVWLLFFYSTFVSQQKSKKEKIIFISAVSVSDKPLVFFRNRRWAFSVGKHQVLTKHDHFTS